jgi:glycosyltransferase involved in cell wall biosynthesis
MNVAVLIPIRSGGSGGFVKHLREILPLWKQHRAISRLSIICPEGLLEELDGLGVEASLVDRNDYRTGFREMGRIVDHGGYDVALSTIPRPVAVQRCPVVAMVQNVEPIQNASYAMSLQWRLRRWVLRRETAAACHSARLVLAVSHYVKQCLCERFNLATDRVHAVYHGFNPDESSAGCRPAFDTGGEEFIFAAGSIVPYRGFEDIISALGILRRKGERVPRTVIAGSTLKLASSYWQALKGLASSLGVEDRLVWAGHLNQHEMTWCYNNARMFVQTSRAEACPNIVLEAMGHGCLAISCDHPPMPEFFDTHAEYYPTGNAEQLAERIVDVLLMAESEMIQRSRSAKDHVTKFSWTDAADKTATILGLAVSDGHAIRKTRGGGN